VNQARPFSRFISLPLSAIIQREPDSSSLRAGRQPDPAGEVVERPASVVKELVENALDAEARRVTVTIQNGGPSLIKCRREWFWHDRDDALLALERHATSKLRRRKPAQRYLTRLSGEAIPSIAAVCRVHANQPRTEYIERDADRNRGGKILSVTDGARRRDRRGSTQSIFNLPARRKIPEVRSQLNLRTIEHIGHALRAGHPNVAFKLSVVAAKVSSCAEQTDAAVRPCASCGAQSSRGAFARHSNGRRDVTEALIAQDGNFRGTSTDSLNATFGCASAQSVTMCSMWEVSVGIDLRNLRRAGRLKNRCVLPRRSPPPRPRP